MPTPASAAIAGTGAPRPSRAKTRSAAASRSARRSAAAGMAIPLGYSAHDRNGYSAPAPDAHPRRPRHRGAGVRAAPVARRAGPAGDPEGPRHLRDDGDVDPDLLPAERIGRDADPRAPRGHVRQGA